MVLVCGLCVVTGPKEYSTRNEPIESPEDSGMGVIGSTAHLSVGVFVLKDLSTINAIKR